MSNLVIEVLSSTVTTVPTAKGSYQVCELAYKNRTFQNKVEGKKLMSFSEKEAFATLQNANNGDVFTVTRVKDEKGYWKWSAATAGESAAASQTASDAPGKAPNWSGNPSPKSNYETPEERAHRQVMIVRQSSISSAVAMLTVNNKKHITVNEVIDAARMFEAFVMGKSFGPIETAPAVESGLDDEIPF